MDFLPNHTSPKLLSYYRDHLNFLLNIFYQGKYLISSQALLLSFSVNIYIDILFEYLYL